MNLVSSPTVFLPVLAYTVELGKKLLPSISNKKSSSNSIGVMVPIPGWPERKKGLKKRGPRNKNKNIKTPRVTFPHVFFLPDTIY